ncbi:MAG: sugar phosphate isomerase/epimerase family protein [Eubacteriales bacterium]
MIQFGCAIPGGSFMPEGVAEIPDSPDVQIREKCRAVLAAGFDFTECGGGMLTALTPAQRYNFLNENARNSLKIRAVNSLFPPSFRLADPNGEQERYVEYASALFDTMHELGASCAVLGSGAARTIHSDQYDYEKGLSVLTNFITAIGAEAEKRGILLVIEPLRKAETNIFITVPESGDFVRKLNQPGVKLLYDAFHMAEEGTDVSCVCQYADLLRHCHIAEAPNRSYPGALDGKDLTYNRRFAKELLKSGYDGGVSVECGFSDFAREIKLAHRYLTEIFQ